MPIIPILGCGAVFSSSFFALRGMANLPVESFKTEGTLWFTNLSAVDPFYLLPLLTSASLFINIKVGGDGADQLPPFLKKVMLFLPIMSLPVMCQFPLVSRYKTIERESIRTDRVEMFPDEKCTCGVAIGRMDGKNIKYAT